MNICNVQLNQTLEHVVSALYEFNRKGNLKCYPGFQHNKMSDTLLNARKLLHSYIDDHNTWQTYKNKNKWR
jgi:hypothetical protein